MTFEQIGQQLMHARKARRLTQQDLASLLGMSRSTISGIEQGTIPEIGVRKIIAMCEALGVMLVVQTLNDSPAEKP